MPKRIPIPDNSVRPRDRSEWRAWLEVNYSTASGIFLVYYKKASGRPCVSYAEAVEEALCFGWIDSRANSVDDECWTQLFTPRKLGSTWSKPNKERVARLTASGLMHPAGLVKIRAAKKDGSWSILDPVDNLVVPPELEDGFARNAAAAKEYSRFSDSRKRQVLWQIYSAKRAETRRQRIERLLGLIAQSRTH